MKKKIIIKLRIITFIFFVLFLLLTMKNIVLSENTEKILEANNWEELETIISSDENKNYNLNIILKANENWIANKNITINENQNVILLPEDQQEIVITRDSEYKGNFITSNGNLSIGKENMTGRLVFDGNGENVEDAESIILISSGNIKIYNTTLKNNKAKYNGGGIYLKSANIEISNTTFDNNIANSGGAIIVNGCTGTIHNSKIENNIANNNGGGIYLTNSSINISQSNINNNTAKNFGGGIYISSTGKLNLDNIKIKENIAETKSGGAVLNFGNLVISGEETDISYNNANEQGGAIRSDGELILNGGNIHNNECGISGGGINFSEGTISYNGGTIENNTAGSNGTNFYPDMNNNIDWTLDESLNLTTIYPNLVRRFIKGEERISTGQLQGMIVTDKYIIFAQVISDTDNTIINIVSKNNLELLETIDTYCFGHANDMAYNSNTDEIYILSGASSSDKITKFKINSNFEITDLQEINLSRKYSSIAYDSDHDYFIGYNSPNIIIMNNEFEEIKSFDAPSNLVHQGISYWNNHIYFSCYERGTITASNPNAIYNNKEKNSSLIYMYDMNGNLKRSLYIPNTSISGEIESVSLCGNSDIYFAYNVKIDEKETVSIYKSDVLSKVAKIELANEITKKSYIQNEERLDLTGGKIKVIYNDNSEESINMNQEGVEVSGFDNSKLGNNTITVTYMGKETTFDVQITSSKIQPELNIEGLPENMTKDKVTLVIEVSCTYSNLESVKVNDDEVIITDGVGKYEITENGTYTIVVKDSAGNETKEEVVIDKIYKSGDLNETGKPDTNDLLKVMQHIVAQRTGKNLDKWTLSEKNQIVADVNEDGKIDQRDVLKIKRYLAANRSKEIASNHPDWLDM